MKQYIAAQFSDYGIAEAVSHSAARPAGDPCMSTTFVEGMAGGDFHVTVGWYDWDKVRKFFPDEISMRESPDVEVEILDEAAVIRRITRYTEMWYPGYTASRCVIEGSDESIRAVLVLYRGEDKEIEALSDRELWDLPVTAFDNDEGYDREKYLQFRRI